jgi:DNA-binding MarR family transcriptional regulator
VKGAADHELILAFGRLQGVANRLECILGGVLEVECGISHLVSEALLILGRVGEPGLSMRVIAQEQVLTTGGATRLVDRMETAGLVARVESPGDRRGKLVRLAALGEEAAVRAAQVRLENIKRHFMDPLPRPGTGCLDCPDLRSGESADLMAVASFVCPSSHGSRNV